VAKLFFGSEPYGLGFAPYGRDRPTGGPPYGRLVSAPIYIHRCSGPWVGALSL